MRAPPRPDQCEQPGGSPQGAGRTVGSKGGEGEKFVTNPLIRRQGDRGSFTPTPSVDLCRARHLDRLRPRPADRRGFFRTRAAIRMHDRPRRGFHRPADLVGVGGENNRVYIEKSGADLES
jgi:hypothetical protein